MTKIGCIYRSVCRIRQQLPGVHNSCLDVHRPNDQFCGMSSRYSISFNAPLTLWFTFVCLGVFFAAGIYDGLMEQFFLLRPAFDYRNGVSWLTLMSYSVGHADLGHLLGNLSFILLLGPVLEHKYGMRDVLLMMVLTVLATAVINLLFFRAAIIGCSGIVFMFIMLTSFSNGKRNTVPLTFLLVGVLFLGKEILESYQQDQVAQFAHIIGGVCGSLFGLVKGK